MDKKDSLVLGILSHISAGDKTKNRFTAPEETFEAVKNHYREAEETLKDYKFDITAIGERHAQKRVTWDHRKGLLVHDVGYTGVRPHWTEVADATLLSAVSLLPTLLANAHKCATKNGAKSMKVAADAVLDGVPLPLLPTAKPIVRSLSLEEDSPMLPRDEDELDEEDLDDVDDTEEEVEDEDPSDSFLREIGVSEEAGATTDLPDLEIVLPPAATPVVVEAKRSRSRRKK